MKKFLIISFLIISCISINALPVSASYRFDDVYGPSGSGAQWVAISSASSTVGASHNTVMETSANFVNSPDQVYVRNVAGQSSDAIDTIFFVIPETIASMNFLLSAPIEVQDITFEFGGKYNSFAAELTPTPDQNWIFTFDKTGNTAGEYETTAGTMIIHQDLSVIPSQTLQIPFVISNVKNATAEEKPLEFSTAIRETYTGAGGDIVANDRFAWDVGAPLSIGGTGWIFVPVANANIDANSINYELVTDIKNYSGIRYALQRFDRLGTTTLRPKEWKLDLPSKNWAGANPVVSLDILSHIAPGLITTYEQSFDVISGGNQIYQIYPVDPPSIFNDLNLRYRSIFGIDLGLVNSSEHVVNAFSLIASDPDFLKKASETIEVNNAVMPGADHKGIIGSAVSQAQIGADAINSFTLEAEIPADLQKSNDVTALLPLHVTINLPYSNRLISPMREKFWDEWDKTGNIKELFSQSLGIYIRDADGNNLDFLSVLREQNLFDDSIKMFMDDKKSSITISFMAMIIDGYSTGISSVHDKSLSTDNVFLVIKDGREDNSWGLTFFVAPKDYVSSGAADDGGAGGGGCALGFAPLTALLLFCAASASRFTNSDSKPNVP